MSLNDAEALILKMLQQDRDAIESCPIKTQGPCDSCRVRYGMLDRLTRVQAALGHVADYKQNFEAELAGNKALRDKYGAKPGETMFDFHARKDAQVKRLVSALTKARLELENESCGECGFTWDHCCCPNGDWWRNGEALIKEASGS